MITTLATTLQTWTRTASLTCLLVLVSSCTNQPAAVTDDSLYQALGGQAGIEGILENFINGMADTPAVGNHFAKSDLNRFFEKTTEHICHLSGGPCEYTGDTMARAHGGFGINESEFNQMVELFIDAMEQENIPYRTQNRLIAILAPLRGDIIYK